LTVVANAINVHAPSDQSISRGLDADVKLAVEALPANVFEDCSREALQKQREALAMPLPMLPTPP
jgi:hypothetical protein